MSIYEWFLHCWHLFLNVAKWFPGTGPSYQIAIRTRQEVFEERLGFSFSITLPNMCTFPVMQNPSFVIKKISYLTLYASTFNYIVYNINLMAIFNIAFITDNLDDSLALNNNTSFKYANSTLIVGEKLTASASFVLWSFLKNYHFISFLPSHFWLVG